MEENKLITRDELFKKKEEFHKKLSKISFEKKIKILKHLQKIAKGVKRAKELREDKNEKD